MTTQVDLPENKAVSRWLADLRMECYKKNLENYDTVKVSRQTHVRTLEWAARLNVRCVSESVENLQTMYYTSKTAIAIVPTCQSHYSYPPIYWVTRVHYIQSSTTSCGLACVGFLISLDSSGRCLIRGYLLYPQCAIILYH